MYIVQLEKYPWSPLNDAMRSIYTGIGFFFNTEVYQPTFIDNIEKLEQFFQNLGQLS